MPSLLAFLLFQLLCAPAELTSDADDFGLAGEKLEQAEAQLLHSGRMGSFLTAADKKKDDGQLQKITCDSNKMAVEQIKGLASQVLPQPVLRPRPRLCAVLMPTPPLYSQVVKDMLFNYRPKLYHRGCGRPAPMEM